MELTTTVNKKSEENPFVLTKELQKELKELEKGEFITLEQCKKNIENHLYKTKKESFIN